MCTVYIYTKDANTMYNVSLVGWVGNVVDVFNVLGDWAIILIANIWWWWPLALALKRNCWQILAHLALGDEGCANTENCDKKAVYGSPKLLTWQLSRVLRFYVHVLHGSSLHLKGHLRLWGPP